MGGPSAYPTQSPLESLSSHEVWGGDPKYTGKQTWYRSPLAGVPRASAALVSGRQFGEPETSVAVAQRRGGRVESSFFFSSLGSHWLARLHLLLHSDDPTECGVWVGEAHTPLITDSKVDKVLSRSLSLGALSGPGKGPLLHGRREYAVPYLPDFPGLHRAP